MLKRYSNQVSKPFKYGVDEKFFIKTIIIPYTVRKLFSTDVTNVIKYMKLIKRNI